MKVPLILIVLVAGGYFACQQTVSSFQSNYAGKIECVLARRD